MHLLLLLLLIKQAKLSVGPPDPLLRLVISHLIGPREGEKGKNERGK